MPEVTQDAILLDNLKEQADALGIQYHPNISAAKLSDRIKEKTQESKGPKEAVAKPKQETVPETPGQRRIRLKKKAGALKRIHVTCMNPNKSEWDGELFTVSNSVVGTLKKFVPFDREDGWHVPQIILNTMRERNCQVFYNVKGKNGQTKRQGKLIKEFNIVELDPLKPEELKELERKQAMEQGEGAY